MDGETFYGRHTALSPATVKTNRFCKEMIIESKIHTNKNEKALKFLCFLG